MADLRSPSFRKQVLERTPIANIWGIGQRLADRLKALNVHTAEDLIQYPETLLKKQFGVVVTRTQQELLGHSCLPLTPEAPVKQQVLFTRTFGQRITEYTEMHAAIAYFAERAAEKLRRQDLLCQNLCIMIRTNPKATDEILYKPNAFHTFDKPTSDSRVIINAACKLLQAIWKPGHRYMRGGVLLSEVSPSNCYQPSLLANDEIKLQCKSDDLMRVIDQINQKTNSKLIFAGQLRNQKWQMNQRLLSPRYTTRWQDLPIIKCR